MFFFLNEQTTSVTMPPQKPQTPFTVYTDVSVSERYLNGCRFNSQIMAFVTLQIRSVKPCCRGSEDHRDGKMGEDASACNTSMVLLNKGWKINFCLIILLLWVRPLKNMCQIKQTFHRPSPRSGASSSRHGGWAAHPQPPQALLLWGWPTYHDHPALLPPHQALHGRTHAHQWGIWCKLVTRYKRTSSQNSATLPGLSSCRDRGWSRRQRTSGTVRPAPGRPATAWRGRAHAVWRMGAGDPGWETRSQETSWG